LGTELDLVAGVEKLLSDGNWTYKKDQVVGEARPDFVVTTPHGDQIILEVKQWQATPENTARAIHQAQRYQELTKAAAALIVTAAGQAVSSQFGGLVPAEVLLSTLSSLASTLAQRKTPKKAQPLTPAPKKKVFASMPFAQQYDDTFLVAIEAAALSQGAIAERVDHNGTAGNVVAQIQSMIKAADAIVADLSDSRPNVLHEVGFAEALGKTVIQICSTPASALPFNVRNNQTIQYKIGQTAKLRKRLEAELHKVI